MRPKRSSRYERHRRRDSAVKIAMGHHVACVWQQGIECWKQAHERWRLQKPEAAGPLCLQHLELPQPDLPRITHLSMGSFEQPIGVGATPDTWPASPQDGYPASGSCSPSPSAGETPAHRPGGCRGGWFPGCRLTKSTICRRVLSRRPSIWGHANNPVVVSVGSSRSGVNSWSRGSATRPGPKSVRPVDLTARAISSSGSG